MQSITSNFEKQEYEIFRRFLWLVHVPFAYIYRVLTTVRVYRIIFSHQQLYRSIPFDLPPTVILRFPTYKHLRIREYPRNSKDARKDFFRGRFIGRTLVPFSIVHIFRIRFFHRFSCHPLPLYSPFPPF